MCGNIRSAAGAPGPLIDVYIAGDYGGFRVAEVLDQGMAAAVRCRVVEASDVLWVVLRRVRGTKRRREFRLGCR